VIQTHFTSIFKLVDPGGIKLAGMEATFNPFDVSNICDAPEGTNMAIVPFITGTGGHVVVALAVVIARAVVVAGRVVVARAVVVARRVVVARAVVVARPVVVGGFVVV
jgi:UDP-3-O-[3-hydroxymyristoyl] glucosamine N-acyltransferase